KNEVLKKRGEEHDWERVRCPQTVEGLHFNMPTPSATDCGNRNRLRERLRKIKALKCFKIG
ncbi:hypothetical protein, partial [Muribaculum intestinale]|uniref:hypothetical protein n=1 Tax=Muribaculum intestinale TaxID=1796646 RepID=UPI0025B6BB37